MSLIRNRVLTAHALGAVLLGAALGVAQAGGNHGAAAQSHMPSATHTGLDTALEHASDRAKTVAPPLGGTHPEQSHDGLAKASDKATDKASDKAADKAADKAKTVAPPLGGDPAKAKPANTPPKQ
jgi:hypothetical protein